MACCGKDKIKCAACGNKLREVYHNGRMVVVCSNPKCSYYKPR